MRQVVSAIEPECGCYDAFPPGGVERGCGGVEFPYHIRFRYPAPRIAGGKEPLGNVLLTIALA